MLCKTRPASERPGQSQRPYLSSSAFRHDCTRHPKTRKTCLFGLLNGFAVSLAVLNVVPPSASRRSVNIVIRGLRDSAATALVLDIIPASPSGSGVHVVVGALDFCNAITPVLYVVPSSPSRGGIHIVPIAFSGSSITCLDVVPAGASSSSIDVVVITSNYLQVLDRIRVLVSCVSFSRDVSRKRIRYLRDWGS